MVHKHQNHICLYTHRLVRQIVQDEALSKCRLLLIQDPTLEA